MYIPKHFRAASFAASYDFVEEIGFASLVAGVQNDVVVSHLPIDLKFEPSGEAYLYGHMSKANPLWRVMKDGYMITAIFSSPSAYVSAGWYQALNVPTANYIAVHCKGVAEIIENATEIKAALKYSTERRERKPTPSYDIEHLPQGYLEQEIKGLVAFKICVTEIIGNFKLSQNRNDIDYRNIMHELRQRGSANDMSITKYMETIYASRDGSSRSDEPMMVYRVAQSEEEKRRVYDSRYRISAAIYPFLFTSDRYGHVAKDAFDDESYIYYCEADGQVVASCRATPCINGKWEITDSLPRDFELQAAPTTTLQLNRVYIEENFRRINLHEKLFFYFSLWVLENTPYTQYFATCNAGLVRLYKRLGAKVATPEGLNLKGRLDHKYYVVEGEISDFSKITKELHGL